MTEPLRQRFRYGAEDGTWLWLWCWWWWPVMQRAAEPPLARERRHDSGASGNDGRKPVAAERQLSAGVAAAGPRKSWDERAAVGVPGAERSCWLQQKHDDASQALKKTDALALGNTDDVFICGPTDTKNRRQGYNNASESQRYMMEERCCTSRGSIKLGRDSLPFSALARHRRARLAPQTDAAGLAGSPVGASRGW
jgi:hypothetical protein